MTDIFIRGDQVKIHKGDTVFKKWGHELIIENNEEYCSKILYFNEGAKCSYHFHINKKESWCCVSGKFVLKLKNPSSGKDSITTLSPGDCITIPRGLSHQLICSEKGAIFESSTFHEDFDSYRIAPGDSQAE